jgi:peptidoglycan/xylan/chitin deacetylase (PgdA/CDA1 family)
MAALLPGPFQLGKHLHRTGLDVIFPFYHAVSNQPLPHLRHLYPIRSTAAFEKDLDYLLKYFEPVKMSTFLGGNRGSSSQKPPMVLSFDDGLIQCYEEIMPLLLKRGIPATFFLNNDFVDNRSMFFRFKVSLLLEHLPEKSTTEIEQAAEILQCHASALRKRLQGISYLEREMTDQLAGLWSLSFDAYLSAHPVYLSSSQIKEMMAKGFEFGSHGNDHPPFSIFQTQEGMDHIRQSIGDLKGRFGLDYSYFAFPFTDYGVKDETIERLFSNGIIEAGFGTAGLKEDRWPGYFQRVPMEMHGAEARSVLRGELNRRRVRTFLGRNSVSRNSVSRGIQKGRL